MPRGPRYVAYVERRDSRGRPVRMVTGLDTAIHKKDGALQRILTVIIPAYGQQELVQAAVSSVHRSIQWPCYQIVVVDDGSPSSLQIEGAQVVRSEENKGFAAACNLGASSSKGGILLFLNSDAELRPGCIEEMMEYIHRGRSVVGAMLLYPDGKIQHAGMEWDIGLESLVHVKENRPTRLVTAVSGACLMTTRSHFKALGGFSLAYGRGYFEDCDFCWRTWEKGGTVQFVSTARAMHREHMTFGKGRTPDTEQLSASHKTFLDRCGGGDHRRVYPASHPPCSVSVIIPVHNNLADTQACISAALRSNAGYPARWILVDDASDEATSNWLPNQPWSGNFHLIRNEKRRGYVGAVLAGLKHVRTPFVCLLNSDTVPTRGWLEKMMHVIQSDPKIGLVNPVCNNAANLSIDLLPGSDLEHMSRSCVAAAPLKPVDVVYPVGMCLLIRSQTWNDVGGFDTKTFPLGYGEETDFAERAIQAGWRTVLAPSAFVYHRGKGSHGADKGKEMEKTGVAAFFSKHGYRASKRLEAFEKEHKIDTLRAKLFAAAPADSRPPVTFYMNELNLCGGVLACYHIARRLSETHGFRAVVSARDSLHHAKMEAAGHVGPFIVRSERSFPAEFSSSHRSPQRGFLVATVCASVDAVVATAQKNKNVTPVYFIQDDESQFRLPNGDYYFKPEKVLETYAAIPNRITNSPWVHDHVQAKGFGSHMIPVGVDSSLFYPREKNKAFTVIAMSRPSTPRRGYALLAKTARQLKKLIPDARMVVYGQPPLGDDRFYMEYAGFLSQAELAELMGKAHVLIEPSEIQGFGLPGLEAMASGCAVVSTDNKGILAYGKQQHNCLIQSDLAYGVKRLYDDSDLLKKMQENARKTGVAFDWDMVAVQWSNYLWSLR